jgi:hypothetical protein
MLKILLIKNLLTVLFVVVGAMTGSVFAQGHHAKHNMILFGSNEVFAYHIVYKAPHNYQVILRVNFDNKVKQEYLAAKLAHPNDFLIFLLNPLDISQISKLGTITGTLLRKDSSENEVTIASDVELKKDNFKVLFFDELPLSLAGNHPMHSYAKPVQEGPSYDLGDVYLQKGKNDCPYVRDRCKSACQKSTDPYNCYIECVNKAGC